MPPEYCPAGQVVQAEEPAVAGESDRPPGVILQRHSSEAERCRAETWAPRDLSRGATRASGGACRRRRYTGCQLRKREIIACDRSWSAGSCLRSNHTGQLMPLITIEFRQPLASGATQLVRHRQSKVWRALSVRCGGLNQPTIGDLPVSVEYVPAGHFWQSVAAPAQRSARRMQVRDEWAQEETD